MGIISEYETNRLKIDEQRMKFQKYVEQKMKSRLISDQELKKFRL